MSWTPENSAIRVTPDLERQIANAGPEEIKSLLHQAALDQGLATPDPFSPDVLIPTPLADNAPKRFASTLVVNGDKKIFEGESELDVQRQVNACLRETFEAAQQLNDPARQKQQAEQPRNERGQFVSAEDAAAQAELELAFKRGDISTDLYLTRSGAIERHLEAQGISPDALREVSTKQFEQSWASATDEFKARHPEWPGTEQNRNLIGQILADNDLVDAEDKVAALEAAYNAARENGLLVANPEVELQQRINEARTPEEIRAALGIDERQRSAGFWR